MKKSIQASPESGIALNLPQPNPRKIRPKNGSARLMTSSMRAAYRLPLNWSIFPPVNAKAAWPSSGVPRTVGGSRASYLEAENWDGHEAPAQLLQATRDRRAGPAARPTGQAGTHDPLRPAAHREGTRQGAGADRAGRRGAWQPRGCDSGRCQDRGARRIHRHGPGQRLWGDRPVDTRQRAQFTMASR